MASEYTLISAPRFNEAHNIYVHATNVKNVVGDSDFKNIYTYGSGSLIDGAFINYFGEIVTDYTDTLEMIDQWHKYSVEFTLENYVALNCEGYPNYNFSKVMDDLNAQNNTVIANDSVEGEKIASGKTIKLPKQEIQTTKELVKNRLKVDICKNKSLIYYIKKMILVQKKNICQLNFARNTSV